jgi:hypothetical protein
MPPQQRQRLSDVVGDRLHFGAHGSLRSSIAVSAATVRLI